MKRFEKQAKTAARAALMVATLAGVSLLAGCATTGSAKKDTGPVSERVENPRLALDYYPMQAQSRTDSIHLRINTTGFSQNQVNALNQVAGAADWRKDQPISIEIVTAETPEAIKTGETVVKYLMSRHVFQDDIVLVSQSDQPEDIVSVNTIYYRAHAYDCNRTWENLSKTGDNNVYDNFGCAVSSNLAAQIADPRDLTAPTAMASTDASRKTVIFGKYREGKITSQEKDEQASGSISQAIK